MKINTVLEALQSLIVEGSDVGTTGADVNKKLKNLDKEAQGVWAESDFEKKKQLARALIHKLKYKDKIEKFLKDLDAIQPGAGGNKRIDALAGNLVLLQTGNRVIKK